MQAAYGGLHYSIFIERINYLWDITMLKVYMHDTSGAPAIEYALLVALIALLIINWGASVSAAINKVFADILAVALT